MLCGHFWRNTYTDEAVLGLELLGRLQVIVDQSEASRLSTTESGAETEAEDNLLIDLVHLGELLAELILGDVGTSRVDDIHDLRLHFVNMKGRLVKIVPFQVQEIHVPSHSICRQTISKAVGFFGIAQRL